LLIKACTEIGCGLGLFVALGCGVVVGRAAVADGVAADAAGELGDEASGPDVVAGSTDVQATNNRPAGNTQSGFTPASIAATELDASYCCGGSSSALAATSYGVHHKADHCRVDQSTDNQHPEEDHGAEPARRKTGDWRREQRARQRHEDQPNAGEIGVLAADLESREDQDSYDNDEQEVRPGEPVA
jgi:hypothetical protein